MNRSDNSNRTVITIAALAALILLVAAILLWAGFGTGDEPTPTPMPTPTSLPDVAAAAAEAPVAEEATPTPAGGVSPLADPNSPMPTPTSTPTPLPPPDVEIEAGKSAVIGRVVNMETGAPIANAIIRLPEVYCPEDVKPEEKNTRCFWALDDAFSPSTFSDADGNFEFLNVEARDYVLFVGDISTKYNLSMGEKSKPIIYTTPADVGLNLGTLPVGYP